MASDLNRLEFDLQQAGFVVAHQASRIVVKTGHDVVRDAQAMCPVDTGNLRSSISVDFRYNGLEFEAGPTASYGRFVEEGTSRMAPHAYLGPAFDRNVPGAVTALGVLGATVIEGTGT
jgi:HK97 gp10 family phage protein